jgi:DNA-binding transcriptional ArsR family regulator
VAGPSRDQDRDHGAQAGDRRQVPEREIRDPRVLRAMAHPVRLSILEQLATRGAATATELSERLDESPANCSWHLRQLARYGFIEEAEGGTGRQRPWRLVHQANRVPEAPADQAEFARASDTLIDVMLTRESEMLRGWLATRAQAPPQWRDASFATLSWDYLTADELAAFKREFWDLFERSVLQHADRIDPARRPAEARPVRFVTWAFPAETRSEPPSRPPAHEGD